MGIRIGLILASMAAFAASASSAADKTFDKRFTVTPGGHLTVQLDVGSVTVVGGDSHEVVVHAEVSGSNLDSLKITADQDSSGVTVTARESTHFFLIGKKVKFSIGVPRDYPIDLETSGGSLEVSNLTASVKGKTSGGSISIREIAGPVNMHTSGGPIEAEGLKGPTLELESSGGSIEVKDATGDLDVRTSGGHIELAKVDGKVKADTSGGGIHVEARSNHGISLRTSGGSISLLLPEKTPATLDAETSGGSTRSDIPVTVSGSVDSGHLRGTINGGGDPIYLRTSGGSIRVEALR
jgi:hypothetical protein